MKTADLVVIYTGPVVFYIGFVELKLSALKQGWILSRQTAYTVRVMGTHENTEHT